MTTTEVSQVLNKQLYLSCKQIFNYVRIQNKGESQQRQLGYDVKTNTHKAHVRYSGEYYVVSCPFCNDTRYRLYINHRFGTPDEFGRTETHLAHCFNEDCLSDYRNREKLFDLLRGHFSFEPVIRPGKVVDISKFTAEWPGEVTRVDKLPPDHEARHYLESRGFSADRVGSFYNVHFCHASDRWLCKNRLIIPIYQDKKMRGWQARYVGDLDWKDPNTPPKYYTCPGTPRAQLLYNGGNASNYCTGIITEGVTDVWSVGPMAVCTFGATMTAKQQSMFIASFKNHSGVLLFDPEEMEKDSIQRLIGHMKGKFRHGFAAVTLPDGVDPGSLERDTLRGYVAEKAAEQGCKVAWKKRKVAVTNE